MGGGDCGEIFFPLLASFGPLGAGFDAHTMARQLVWTMHRNPIYLYFYDPLQVINFNFLNMQVCHIISCHVIFLH
jgi:hypothetical protein